MGENSLISIILPCYNGEHYLSEAISSLQKQTYGHFELIVVDDGSVDGSWALLESIAKEDPRIRIYRNHQNRGVIDSLNIGLELCKGEYVARMDADDLSRPRRLEEQIAFLKGNPEVAMVSVQGMAIDKKGRFLKYLGRHRCYSPIDTAFLAYWESPFIHPAIMIRRKIIQAFKYHNSPDLHHVEDYDLWLRLFEGAIKMAILPHCLFCYRIADSSVSQSNAHEQFERGVALSMRYLHDSLGLYIPVDNMTVLREGVWALKNISHLKECLQNVDDVAVAYCNKNEATYGVQDWNPVIRWVSERKIRVMWLALIRSNIRWQDRLGILFFYLPYYAAKGFYFYRLWYVFNEGRFKFLSRLYKWI